MTDLQLGRLEKVDLRSAWESEDRHFTPWLAEPDNITILGDTIGLDLEVEAQEKEVGPFRADILCKDRVTDDWVLIENQLERTDHTHLGQLMTYAAGLNAVTIVWIAKKFTEEHRAALDWLNDITDSSFNFFGLEVELWRIQDSPVAPRFNVVCKPNTWTRNVAGAARNIAGGQSSEKQECYIKFWTRFVERVEERGNPIRAPKPHGHYMRSFSLGKAYFYIYAMVPIRDKWIGVQLTIKTDSATDDFRRLEARKDEIEQLIGEPLEWRELPQYQESQIRISKPDMDLADDTKWMEIQDWLIDHVKKFQDVFGSIVVELDETKPLPSADSDA
jgi:hypothetical protein